MYSWREAGTENYPCISKFPNCKFNQKIWGKKNPSQDLNFRSSKGTYPWNPSNRNYWISLGYDSSEIQIARMKLIFVWNVGTKPNLFLSHYLWQFYLLQKKRSLEISDSFMAALLCIHEVRLDQKIVLVSENISKIQRPNKSELYGQFNVNAAI